MPIRVETDDRGVRLLVADIAEAASGINGRIAEVYADVGPTILRSIKSMTPVDTGALKESQDFSINKRQATIRFGPLRKSINPKSGQPASAYHRYVEFGARGRPGVFMVKRGIEKHAGPSSRLMRGLGKAGVIPIDRRVEF